MPKRKKARELTTEQALRRLFPKQVRKALKAIALEPKRKPTKKRKSIA